MTRFIKLSNVIINTKFINAILFEPKLYTIYIVNYNIISNWINFIHNDK
jgi:hypothetical protein